MAKKSVAKQEGRGRKAVKAENLPPKRLSAEQAKGVKGGKLVDKASPNLM